jgi:DNA-directed RNA polymerase subunit RPC12/RpoP
MPRDRDESEEMMEAPEQGAPEAATTEGSRFPCAKCGAKLEFKPGADSLHCPYCGHENAIEGTGQIVEEMDFSGAINELESSAEVTEHELVKCDACAAEIDRPPNVTSLSCPYCGSNIVLQSIMRRLVKPRSLLPFAIERGNAAEKVRGWIKSLWFAPNAIKRFADIDGVIKGIYYPAWTYDCKTITDYTGFRGDAYYVTVSYTAIENGKSVRRTRQERRIRWSPRWGTVRNTFDDVLVLASTSLPEAYAHKLEPWDLKALAPYQDQYLAGFLAESYSIGLSQGFDIAKDLMAPTIDSTIRRDIGGDEQRISSRRTQYNAITFKHILLPIWIGAYRFRSKLYRVLINARTGEVQGERPYSWIKITLAVLAALVVIAAIIVIAQLKDR